jgi:hypothetical protein
MPRIPTSKPQDVRSRPSVGGQVNLSSQDAFFRSIASASQEAGQLFEQARVEKQKLIDQKAINEQKINQRESLNNLNILLSDPEITSDKYGGVIDSWYEENQEFVPPVGISKTLAESLKQDHSGFLQIGRSNAEVATVEKLQRETLSTAGAISEVALEDGNWQEALDVMAPFQSPQQRDAYVKRVDFLKKQNLKKSRKESALAVFAMARTPEEITAAGNELINSGVIFTEEEKDRRIQERLTEVKLEDLKKTKEEYIRKGDLAVANNDDAELGGLIEELEEIVGSDNPFVDQIRTQLARVNTAQANAFHYLSRQSEIGIITQADINKAVELNLISESDKDKFNTRVEELKIKAKTEQDEKAEEKASKLLQEQIDNEDKNPIFREVRGSLDKRLGEWFSGKITNKGQVISSSEIKRFKNNINALNVTSRQKAILTSRLSELEAIATTNYNPDGWGGFSPLDDEDKAEITRLSQVYSKHAYPASDIFVNLPEYSYEEGVIFNSLLAMQETMNSIAVKMQKGEKTIDGKSFDEYVRKEASSVLSGIYRIQFKQSMTGEEQNNSDQN